MGEIPRKGPDIPTRKVGVESAHGFGDGLFNIPLIKAISEKHQSPVTVTTKSHCIDAFVNHQFISEILSINEMGQGISLLKGKGYKHVYQITQNVKFFEFRQQNGQHSLVDTPLITGRQIGVQDFPQRPLFAASPEELKTELEIPHDKPIIAIESHYKSGQSWAQRQHIMTIVQKFIDTHRILWLSNQDAPQHPNVDNMLRFTRRQCIMCLHRCQYFFSVGSGFFCAHLALPDHLPNRTICLWTDSFYHYEGRLAELDMSSHITWVHGEVELKEVLETL